MGEKDKAREGERKREKEQEMAVLTRTRDLREEKLRLNTNTSYSIPKEKTYSESARREQRDAMRRSDSVQGVALSPEAESGLLQHFPDHCVAVEFP